MVSDASGFFGEFDRDIGIVEILQALAGLGVGQEEIPQAFFLGFRLGLPEHVELRVCVKLQRSFLPSPWRIKFDRHRVDGFPDEFLDVLEQRPDLIRHPQIVEFFARIEIVGRRAGHIGVFHGVSPIGADRFVWARALLVARQCRRLRGLCTSRRRARIFRLVVCASRVPNCAGSGTVRSARRARDRGCYGHPQSANLPRHGESE